MSYYDAGPFIDDPFFDFLYALMVWEMRIWTCQVCRLSSYQSWSCLHHFSIKSTQNVPLSAFCERWQLDIRNLSRRPFYLLLPVRVLILFCFNFGGPLSISYFLRTYMAHSKECLLNHCVARRDSTLWMACKRHERNVQTPLV